MKYWKYAYILIIGGMIVFYPNFVSDGHNWTFVEKKNNTSSLALKINGFDISKHNGDIEWSQINSARKSQDELKFVFMKATEGTDLIDHKFEDNWQNAKTAGLYRGAYHFYLLGKDPKMQALNFILHVKRQNGDLRPVLDFETYNNRNYSAERVLSDIKTWLDIVENAFGSKPIIYTNYPMYKKIIKGNFNEYPIWLSDFTSDNLLHFEGEKPIFWQYSQTGKIPGFKTNVDLNVFLGSEHKFLKYIQ
jgi:lysozyme